jgi:hypothetical protein
MASLSPVSDMSPEEYERRGEAAAELWRELVRRAERGSEEQEP